MHAMMGGIIAQWNIKEEKSQNMLVCLFVLILTNLLFFSLSTCAKFGSNVFQKKLYLKVWRAHFAWRPTQPEKLILNIWFPTSTNNIKFWKKVKYYSSATWFLRERIKQGQKSTSGEGEGGCQEKWQICFWCMDTTILLTFLGRHWY